MKSKMNKIQKEIEINKSYEQLIKSHDSGIYTSINEDGVEVIVLIQQNESMTIMTPLNTGWHEVVYYDKHGDQEGVTYERLVP